MGYVADRWHRSRPAAEGDPTCEHRGRVPSASHGKGKRWQARYDGPDGRERTALFATRVEAERHLVKQEHDKATGSWLDPRAGRITVERFALEVWLPSQSIIDRTRVEYLGALRRYVFPEWGGREMRSIKPSEAGAWQQALTARYGLSGSYPNRVARLVRGMFRLAVVDRVIPVSPFDGIKAPTLAESAVHPPDVPEVRRLIAAAYRPRWAVMLELAALTGLRSGELRGLTVGSVDFLRKALRVERQIVKEKGERGGLSFADLKTGAGRRVIPLSQRAVDLLAAYMADYPPAAGGPWAGLVFAMPDGEPVQHQTLDWALKRTCELAGVEPRHWHELRHHYASVLIGGGENPTVVQRRLGHRDISTTLRTYSHMFAEAEERTRGVLDAAWAVPGEAVPDGSSGSGGRIPESRGKVAEFRQVRR